MPVVKVFHDRLKEYLKGETAKKKILERLPYLGLDIEEEAEDYVRVEYNPNRPDYSTDLGIARGLNGLLGFEVGLPEYPVKKGRITVSVDRSVIGVRPFIVCLVVRGVPFDDESIRQMISMQEDLHNGVGRKRKKVSIGIHNLDVITPPIRYTTVKGDFSFVPLNEKRSMSVSHILGETEIGRSYGWILRDFERYPMLLDSPGNVLSFPPIINGELTRISEKTRNLFIDVTATNLAAAENSLSVLAAYLHDLGGRLESVEIHRPKGSLTTPDLTPSTMELDVDLARSLLGLDLKVGEAVECLSRSRLSCRARVGRIVASIPRYRFDIMHPIDLVEEMALGYGIDRIAPTLPMGASSGRRSPILSIMDSAREVMVGQGMTEVMSYHLVPRSWLTRYSDSSESIPSVDSPKSSEHEVLRDSLVPSLLDILARNIHEPYPQRIFEVGKAFRVEGTVGVNESYHLAGAMAHSSARFTEAKSALTGLLVHTFGIECETIPGDLGGLEHGRAARVRVNGEAVGLLGEVSAGEVAGLGLRTPVAVFEVNLSRLLQITGRMREARSDPLKP